GLRGDGVRPRRDEAEPPGDPVHVRVDREIRTVEGEEEDARRGLRPDPREPEELLPQLRVGHPGEGGLVQRDALIAHRAEHRADPHRLRWPETAASDRARDRRERCGGDVFPPRKTPPQVRVRAVAVRVARVLREDGEDELVEWRQMSRGGRIAVRLREPPRDREKTAPLDDVDEFSLYRRMSRDRPASSTDPEQEFLDGIVSTEVKDALAALPEKFRATVLLDVEGFSYKEIAEMLQIPIGTVMSRLH